MAVARVVEIAFIGSTAQLEAALARAGITADVTSKGIQDSFNKGTSSAGGAITTLGKKLESMGVVGASSLTKVGSALDQATTKTSKLGSVMSELGKASLVGGLAAFAVVAAVGVKGAMALQQQMELLKTQAGATQAQVNTLNKGILNMASSVGTSPQALAEGMYHVVSSLNATIPAAQRVSTEMSVLKVAAEGAKVGNANLTDVTNALDAAVVSGIGGVHNYQQAMGALNATVGAGDMTMQDLADALGTGLLAPAKTFGLSIKDVGAALAVFGDNNIRGAEAATKLRQALVMMGAPSAAASAALASIGLGQTQLANDMRGPQGLVGALTDLQSHLNASGANASQQALILSRAFGGGKTATAVMLLLDQLDRLKAKETAVGQGASGFGAAWTTTTHNLSFEWSQVTAGAAAFADKLGMFLIPKIQQLGNFVAHNKTVLEDFAKAIGTIIGAAIVLFVGTKVVSFVSGIGKMSSSVEALILKMTGAKVGIGTDFAAIGTDAQLAAAKVDSAAGLGGVGAAADTAVGKVNNLKLALAGIAGKVFVVTLVAQITEQLTSGLPGVKGHQNDVPGFLQALNKIPLLGAITGTFTNLGLAARQGLGMNNGTTTGPAQTNFSVSQTGANGTMVDTPLPKGTTAAQYAAIQKYMGDGQPLNVAEQLAKGATVGPALPANYHPPAKTPTTHQPSTGGAAGGAAGGGAAPSAGAPQLTGALAGYLATQSGQVALQKAQLSLASMGQRASQIASWGPRQLGTQEVGGLQRAGIGVTGMYGQAATIGHIRAATTPAAEAKAAGMAGAFNASNNPTLVAMAQNIETSWDNLTNKLATIVSSDTKAGQSELAKLQAAQNSTSFSSLKDAVTGVAQTNFHQMVTDLSAIHTKAMTKLADQLNTAMAAAKASYNSVLATLKTTARGDAAELAAQRTTAQTTKSSNAAQAATGISGLQNTQLVDSINAQVTQINDAAKIGNDLAAQQVSAIQATTTAIQDAANAQISSIQDTSQIQVDTLGERGLYGLYLQAQMAKVALDQLKAIDDAKIAASQAHLDQVTAQTNAATLAAQTNLDRVTQQTDAVQAAAQATADSVAIQNAVTLAAAQAQADSVAITTAINNAAAQAHTDQMMFGNIQQQDTAQAAQKLVQGQSDLATANAQATLAQTTSTVNASNQNAQNAYALQQAYASQQQAIAAAQLATMQNAASTQQALAQQQLSVIQNTAAVAEAKQQAQVNLLQEMANVEFKGAAPYTVNLYGINAQDPMAYADAMGWTMRTRKVS